MTSILAKMRSTLARVVRRGGRRRGTERDAARIAALERHVPLHGVGAEIGVHKGYFTPLLLERLQPSQLHLIDPWYRVGREWNFGLPDRSTVNALCGILRRHEDELVDGRIVLHIGLDLDVLATVPDATFDWVYVDTTHAYKQTLQELDALQHKTKPDGSICGDDWRSDPQHPHHGAVREFVADGPYELTYDDDQQWVIRRPPDIIG